METINYQEVKKSKEFQKGVQDFEERKCGEQGSAKIIWVKRTVAPMDYKKDYKDNSDYCFLEKTEQGVSLGFCVAYHVPIGCELLTDEEAIKVDSYRQSVNIAPLPLS